MQRRAKGRFTTLESEREQQRKLYEDNLRKKKEQLYFEFEKQEEVLKYTKISVECHNDINFKYEQDRVANYRSEKENELNNLKQKLRDIQQINKMQEQLPEGQSSQGQIGKGANLTSIFSKSYYKSQGIQMMTNEQQKSREEINNYLAYMQDEIKQVEENSKNEEQRQSQLTKSMQELFKTKQKFKEELHDLEFLNDTADRRFHDIKAVQFKAKEKKILIDKDLNSVKKSLKEYNQIGDKYKEKQLIKMKNGERIKKTAEEIITHDMIKQDELERENQLLLKQIQLEVMKHQSIIQKRSESKYILKHIECFTKFEKLFLEGPIKEKEIEEMYESNNMNRESQLNITGSECESSPQGNPYMFQQFPHLPGIRSKNSTISSVDSRSPNHSPKLRSSFHIQQEENRMSLIQKINKFDMEHPNGAKNLVDEMVNLYNAFSSTQQGLNSTHKRLLEEKARKQQEMQGIDSNLQSIKQMNLYIDEMEKNPQYEKEMLQVPESFDSGLMMIPKSFEKLNNNKNTQTNIKSYTNLQGNLDVQQVMSTLNIVKSDNFQIENDKIKENVKKNQNFIFNFFSNYCESAIRLCQILELIYNISLNYCPVQIEKLAKSTIKFIKDIWAGKFDEKSEQASQKNKKKQSTSIQRIGNLFNKFSYYQNYDEYTNFQYRKLLQHAFLVLFNLEENLQLMQQLQNQNKIIGTQELLNGEEIQEVYFKQIQSEKYSEEEIQKTFKKIFPKKTDEAERFYNLIKLERMVWFFCNIEQIMDYLIDQKKKNGLVKGCISVFDNIDILKDQGIAIFENKLTRKLIIEIQNKYIFQQIQIKTDVMELMVRILLKIKESSNICLKVIRTTFPDYSTKRRFNNKNLRQNADTKEAIQYVTTKIDNYYKNNDPLMEDFIILRREAYNSDNILMMNNQNEEDYYDEQQSKQKKKEEQKQNQINILIDYIKKTKNNSQQIIQEKKKLQVLQMQKSKQLQDSDQNQNTQAQNTINGANNNNQNTTDGINGIIRHRGSNQSLYQVDMKDKSVRYSVEGQQYGSMQQISSNAPQQLQSNQPNQIDTDQDDGRVGKFYVNPQYKEDIIRHKQLNKQENLIIEKERERIHNLPKQKYLQEQQEIERQLQLKNNKFFISDEITEINNRLYAENKAPYKEKLIRTFSESQLVLSKVDRMDRFSGFIGPQVKGQIQDEKKQIIRTLRGELYKPELNYLKSNNAYHIRKQISQEQINYLHEIKLQQTIQLNQSHSQSIQNSSKKQNQNSNSFNQDEQQKQNKQDRSFSSIVNAQSTQNQDQFGAQLSQFYKVNSQHQSKQMQNSSKQEQNNEEKVKKSKALYLKLKEIKSVINLPSSGFTSAENRPSTQSSKQRIDQNKNRHHHQRGVSSYQKETINTSNSHYDTGKTKIISSLHENLMNNNNNIYTPSRNTIFGGTDILSSENSILQNNNNGPYNHQNLKFYQRYTSPEGDAFFDSILYGQSFSKGSQTSRPKTQQNNYRQSKEQMRNNNDQNNFVKNNFFSLHSKPQSSHEGKRDLFYKSSQPQEYGFAPNMYGQDDQSNSYKQQNQHKRVKSENKEFDGESFGQYSHNKNNDLYSYASNASSRTNISTNRLHNQKHVKNAQSQKLVKQDYQ